MTERVSKESAEKTVEKYIIDLPDHHDLYTYVSVGRIYDNLPKRGVTMAVSEADAVTNYLFRSINPDTARIITAALRDHFRGGLDACAFVVPRITDLDGNPVPLRDLEILQEGALADEVRAKRPGLEDPFAYACQLLEFLRSQPEA